MCTRHSHTSQQLWLSMCCFVFSSESAAHASAAEKVQDRMSAYGLFSYMIWSDISICTEKPTDSQANLPHWTEDRKKREKLWSCCVMLNDMVQFPSVSRFHVSSFCLQQGHAGSKILLLQNPSVCISGFQLMEVDLFSCQKKICCCWHCCWAGLCDY